jgi:23S rRNA (guanine1835-N2)-methyltransferase
MIDLRCSITTELISNLMKSSKPVFDTPFGSYQLQRYPEPQRGQQQSLRAWDAADELILNWLNEQQLDEQLLSTATQIMTVNDAFGALSVPLHKYQITMMSDSYLGHEACRKNLALNSIATNQVETITSLDKPDRKADYVIIKVPKTLALLEDQLYRLRNVITPNTNIIAAGMVKYIHSNTLKLFSAILGETTTSLAKKKARLIFCQPLPQQWQGDSPFPSSYRLENTSYQINNHANVFSRASLDIGTRLFLEHLPSSNSVKTIIDLGCGNGVVGLIAANRNPESVLYFYDESYMALASAKLNFESAFDTDRKAHYYADNCLQGADSSSADLILNNPPFHQGNVVGDYIALQMFKDAKRVLRQGGELWIIGNRHLGYHIKLKKLFGNVTTVASNKKFVVLKCIKN